MDYCLIDVLIARLIDWLVSGMVGWGGIGGSHRGDWLVVWVDDGHQDETWFEWYNECMRLGLKE